MCQFIGIAVMKIGGKRIRAKKLFGLANLTLHCAALSFGFLFFLFLNETDSGSMIKAAFYFHDNDWRFS